MDKKPPLKCKCCGKISETGDLAIQVCKGIVGVLGFVVLDPPVTLCSEKCLRAWCDGKKENPPAFLPRRLP